MRMVQFKAASNIYGNLESEPSLRMCIQYRQIFSHFIYLSLARRLARLHE